MSEQNSKFLSLCFLDGKYWKGLRPEITSILNDFIDENCISKYTIGSYPLKLIITLKEGNKDEIIDALKHEIESCFIEFDD